MFCKYCGAELPDGTNTCTKCGKVLNRSTEAGKKLLKQRGQLRELRTKGGAGKDEHTSGDPQLALLCALAAVVLGVVFVRLNISGSQTLGLAAIIVAIMAMTGNRKLVPYMTILEMLVDGAGVIIPIAAGIFGAAVTAYGGLTLLLILAAELGGDLLYTSALFKGEKGQRCAWRYLPVLILVMMHFFTAITGPKGSFLIPILAFIVNLPFAAYRFFIIRWMFQDAPL